MKWLRISVDFGAVNFYGAQSLFGFSFQSYIYFVFAAGKEKSSASIDKSKGLL